MSDSHENMCSNSNDCDQLEAKNDAHLSRSAGILKPDIVFFGEGLPEHYHKSINEDKTKCDLLIVIGSSLKVKPVANIPHLLPQQVPQILINRESLRHMNFDIELLGDCDVIVNELLLRLDLKQQQQQQEKSDSSVKWSNICTDKTLLNQIGDAEAEEIAFKQRVNGSSVADLSENSNCSLNNSTVIIQNKNSSIESDNIEASCSNNANKNESMIAKAYTKDYLKENSFLYLKPNVYLFHGAEVSLKNIRKKLKRLRKQNTLSNELDDKTNEFGSSDEESKDFEETDEDDSEEDTEDDDDDEDDDSTEDDEENAGQNKEIFGIEDEDNDEDDEDFTIESSLTKNNLAKFLNENLDSSMRKSNNL